MGTRKYKNNADPHTRTLAFENIVKKIMLQRRKSELELYKLYAQDPAFKLAWRQSLERAVEL